MASSENNELIWL